MIKARLECQMQDRLRRAHSSPELAGVAAEGTSRIVAQIFNGGADLPPESMFIFARQGRPLARIPPAPYPIEWLAGVPERSPCSSVGVDF